MLGSTNAVLENYFYSNGIIDSSFFLVVVVNGPQPALERIKPHFSGWLLFPSKHA